MKRVLAWVIGVVLVGYGLLSAAGDLQRLYVNYRDDQVIRDWARAKIRAEQQQRQAPKPAAVPTPTETPR